MDCCCNHQDARQKKPPCLEKGGSDVEILGCFGLVSDTVVVGRLDVKTVRSSKPDCSDALGRKRPQSCPIAITKTFSPVRFQINNRRIPPISRSFQRNAGGFLCTSDCVAEEAVRRNYSPPNSLLTGKNTGNFANS